MGGGVFQLNVKGLQDRNLTNTPELNFLVQQYKKYVNFSSELQKIEPRENVNFGKKFSCTFKNIGDMLHKMYLCFSLPPLVSTSGTYAGWTNSIGHALIDKVELSIGGEIIDTKYGLFMEIWNELTNEATISSAADKMIGKFRHIPLLQTNAEIDTNYTVPLPFWFCNHISSAFPLLSLYFQELTLTFYLRPFSECIVYDGGTPPNNVDIYNAYILTENIYLEERERLIMRHKPHISIITQTQYSLPQSISLSGFEYIELPFNHTVYELLFVIRETESDNNNDWFNFSVRNPIVNTEIVEFIEGANLITDGIDRYKTLMPSNVLNTLYANRYHTNSTDKHIYIIPFCENPEHPYQPSGSLNFSSIDTVNLMLKIKNTIPNANIHVFALNWNFIKIENGHLLVEYFS
jgi:hypothetical protein